MSETKVEITPYESLLTSTQTMVIYTNLTFRQKRIFYRIDVAPPFDVAVTKKKGYVDKTLLNLPFGAIVSIEHEGYFRGTELKKRSKHKCALCSEEDDEEKTAERFLQPPQGKRGIREVWMRCKRCDKEYFVMDPSLQRKDGKKIKYGFPYQSTIVVALGGNKLANVMLFNTTLKVTGCRTVNESVEGVMVLWEDYIRPIKRAWKSEDGDVKFQFCVVMCNLHFPMGYEIDRERLNALMNKPKYADKVAMAEYETTDTSSVRIRMYHDKKLESKHQVLIYPDEGLGTPYFRRMRLLREGKNKKKDKYITFIVFATSETILSGRYPNTMKDRYEFFIKEMINNRELLEDTTLE